MGGSWDAHGGGCVGGSWEAHGKLMGGSWGVPGAHEGGLMESFLLLFIILRATFDQPARWDSITYTLGVGVRAGFNRNLMSSLPVTQPTNDIRINIFMIYIYDHV